MFYLFIIFVKFVLCIFNDSLQIIFSHEFIFSFRILILQILKKIIVDCLYLMNCRVCEFRKSFNKLKKKYKKTMIYLTCFYFSAHNFSNFNFDLSQSSIHLFIADWKYNTYIVMQYVKSHQIITFWVNYNIWASFWHLWKHLCYWKL